MGRREVEMYRMDGRNTQEIRLHFYYRLVFEGLLIVTILIVKFLSLNINVGYSRV